MISGSVYQLLLALNLSPETRSDIEQLGFWFGPDKFPISMGINIRGSIFGFWLGRVAYNYITNPHRTTEEFKSITISEIRDRMLSSDYLTTWAGRFIFQFFCVMVGITILYSIGASENTLFSRSFVNSSPLDDLNDLVQSSISENFV